MLPVYVYVSVAFLVGILVGGLLARGGASVKFAGVEVHGASVREVAALLKEMHESTQRFKEMAK